MDLHEKIKTALHRPIPLLTRRERTAEEKARSRERARKISRRYRFAVIIVGSVFLVWRVCLAYQVRTHLSRIVAAKLPTNGDELNRWYPTVPDSENGALFLTKIFPSLKELPDTSSNNALYNTLYKIKPSHGRPLTADDWQLLSQYVDINKAALASADDVVSLKQSRYPIDLKAGFNTLLPHLAPLKSLAMLADFDARLAVRNRDPARAVKSWILLLHLAGTLDSEPTAISQLVRIAIIKMAARSIESGLSILALTESQMKKLIVNLDSLEANSMTRALIGERAMAIQGFRRDVFERRHTDDADGASAPTETSASSIERAAVWTTGFFERDLNFYLRVMENVLPICDKAPPQNLTIDRALNREAETGSRKACFLSAMLLPGYSRLMSRQAEAVAIIKCARLALSIELSRSSQPELPTDANELHKRCDVPNDPFTGVALNYMRVPTGYVVYSAGPDRRDDQAKEEPLSPKPADRWDITFFVER